MASRTSNQAWPKDLDTANQSINQSINPLACTECGDSLPFSGASSIPPCHTLFSCHSSPPTILPSSLTSSSHLFLGLPLGLVVSRFIYNTLLGILFSSILCTCPNQRNLCSLIVSVIVGFLIFAYISSLVITVHLQWQNFNESHRASAFIVPSVNWESNNCAYLIYVVSISLCM